MKYIAGTQTYTISLQIPRRWERAKNLELLAFSTSWVQNSMAATCVSLSFLGVHLGASIQQATSKTKAELASMRLATNLAFHTKSLLQDLQLAKPLCFRVLTRGPVPQKLGLSKRTRHIELSSQLGQFQLSKVQPQQNLAELLANNLRACDLHRLLPKLQLQARPAGELALPTVQCEGKAFSSSSLGSFYIGQLCCAPAMEKPQPVQKLSGKEFVDHLAILELESTKLLQQQLSSGGANTALHNELRQTSLQQDELEAAYSKGSLQDQSLQGKELSAAYATALPKQLGQTALAMDLERSASTMSFQQLSVQQHSLQATYFIGSFQPHSLTVTSLSLQDQLLTPYQLDHDKLELEWLKRRQRSSSSLSRTSFGIILVILMIAAFLSKNIFKSFRDRELEETEELQTFPFDWALELVESPVLLTIFWDQKLEEFEEKNLETCRERANEKQDELQTILWEQELAELPAHKTCPLDLLHDHLGQEHLWNNQLRQNPLENEKKKKKLENKELDKKNFQSLIFMQLVALLLEKHFASAASSQLLGYEAWGKYREASEDSSDKVGDKELLQEEPRRQELGCKDLWPAFFWALCPDSFEENSFTEKTFANTSLGKETFRERSLTESSFTDSSLAENSFSENTFLKNSFSENSFDKKSFAQKTFDKQSFDKKSFDKSSFGKSSFGKSSLEESSLAQSSLATSSLEESSLKDNSFGESSLAESSLTTSTSALSSFLFTSFKEKSFEESSFKKSSFNQSSFEERSFDQSSLEESSFTSSFEQSSLEPNSFDNSFGTSSFRSNSFQGRSFHTDSFQTDSFQPDSFQTSSFQTRSLNSRASTAELYQLERTASTTELSQLERPALSTELSPAWKTELEKLRAQTLRSTSFSSLSGVRAKDGLTPRGSAKSTACASPAYVLDLDRQILVLGPLWLKAKTCQSFLEKGKLAPKLSRDKDLQGVYKFRSCFWGAAAQKNKGVGPCQRKGPSPLNLRGQGSTPLISGVEVHPTN